jgi:hypothetical protein
MKTPYDPAIAVTKFLVAMTNGIPRWALQHAAAQSDLGQLTLDRKLWVRKQSRVAAPDPIGGTDHE